MRRTSVHWLGTRLPRSKAEGYGAGPLPIASLRLPDQRHPRARPELPLLVWMSSEVDERKLLAHERTLWWDERVGLASRFFNCYRIDLDAIEDDGARRSYSKDGRPLVLLIDTNGKTVARLSGWKLPAERLLRAMGRQLHASHKLALNPLLDEEAKLLDVLDRTHWELRRLQRARLGMVDHLKVHDCRVVRNRLKRTDEAIAKATKERRESLSAERKLLGVAGPERFVAEQR